MYDWNAIDAIRAIRDAVKRNEYDMVGELEKVLAIDTDSLNTDDATAVLLRRVELMSAINCLQDVRSMILDTMQLYAPEVFLPAGCSNNYDLS